MGAFVSPLEGQLWWIRRPSDGGDGLNVPATCGLCAAAACRDVLATCPAMAVLCNCPVNGVIFKQQCARTCGACPGSPNPIPVPVPVPQPNCFDSDQSGCAHNAYMCRDSTALGAWVRKGCPKTCGLCGTGPLPQSNCFDSDPSGCAHNAYMCNNSDNWGVWVRKGCPRTCGLCTSNPVSNKRVGNAICMDNPRTPCDSFKKQGFCQNTYYTLERRMKACGITCGFC
ncbi:hypothetical protein L596_029207 [Steinernema carpocapsae]|uniref:ShKT domain-containing protein n=1 Tax=Steinernema carpocapsae TaxID=34508 RepID=A0A4U5LTY7_STECR|nr:hypothetical protein L596_029207 [Steinernema carpocapsae]